MGLQPGILQDGAMMYVEGESLGLAQCYFLHKVSFKVIRTMMYFVMVYSLMKTAFVAS